MTSLSEAKCERVLTECIPHLFVRQPLAVLGAHSQPLTQQKERSITLMKQPDGGDN